jgi:hypothetical protein
MKLVILAVALFAGTMLLAPKQKNIAGTWVLDTDSKKCEATVLRIQMREGYFVGALDIAEQQVYDRPVSIQLIHDSVKIMLDKQGTCFLKAAVRDSILVGTSVVSGHTQPVRFYRARNRS